MARANPNRFLPSKSQTARRPRTRLTLEPMEDRITPAIALGIDSLPATVEEGTEVTVSATTDAGSPTYAWTVTLDGAEFATGDASTFSFTPDDDGTYTVTLTVTGIDPATAASGSTTTEALLEVTNAEPEVTLPADAALDEGDTFTGEGSFTDAGTADTFTATVDYGDGTGSQALTLNSDNTFDLSHAYAAVGTFTVTVTVTDDEGGIGTDTFAVTVNNAAPVADIDGPTIGVRGMELSYTLTATDSQADLDAGFTFDIDWGDGTTETVTGLSGEVLPHTYATRGTYTIVVTATDQDGATSEPTELTVQIKATALIDDPLNPGQDLLAVGGTAGNDTIVVIPGGRNGLKVMIGGVSQGRFVGADRIAIFGGDGNDNLHIAGSIRLDAWLDGGEGNDRLKGAKGDDVLEGGEGADRLLGAQGHDILLGGLGRDALNGGPGDDILVGGQLMLEDADLFDINQTWTGGGSFASRLAAVRASDLLTTGDDGTVQDDGEADHIQGAAGRTWIFADTLTDRVLGNKKMAVIEDFDATPDPVVSIGNGNGNGNGNAGGNGNASNGKGKK